MKYLIDTNIISELARAKPNEGVIDWVQSVPQESLFISVLTLGELRKGINKLEPSSKRDRLENWLSHELSEWFGERVVAVDKDVADRWGELLADAGRTLPAIDSLLAATALHFDMRIVTRNTKDFQGLTIKIINPWHSKNN
ncbi:MAG: type II toxin-antitoxin system VapC family toxin [Magnetococcales bacterium]|nr:type II toxin-antitoxin system VapC family toxin [Magnetococcales bacterium]